MARQATKIDNTDIRNLFSNFDNFSDLSNWVQDLIYGACNSGHSKPSSPYALFQALKILTSISLEDVNRYVNNKSETVDGRTFSRTHVYTFMSRLLYARKAILYHYEKQTGQVLHNSYHISTSIVGDFCYFDGVRYDEIF